MKRVLQMMWIIAIGTLAISTWGNAAPINLLTNGSFEDGGGSLTGWTTSGSYIRYPVSIVLTNSSTTYFGESFPPDTAASMSPDATGSHATYFVDDLANQTLSQSLFLATGSYEIGFDAFAPLNGWNNTYDAVFTATIAGVTLANYSVKQTQPRVWVNYSGIADIRVDGTYDVAFNFKSFGAPASDVVIDRVYIIGSDQTGGTPIPPLAVPAPTTLALLSLGIAALGYQRWTLFRT